MAPGLRTRSSSRRGGGKATVRKKGEASGNIMKTWRELRASGDPEVLRFLAEIEVMQQPAGYCDGVVVAWIQEMRFKEGFTRLVTVRDLFAGAQSETASRSSILYFGLEHALALHNLSFESAAFLCGANPGLQPDDVLHPQRRQGPIHPLPPASCPSHQRRLYVHVRRRRGRRSRRGQRQGRKKGQKRDRRAHSSHE